MFSKPFITPLFNLPLELWPHLAVAVLPWRSVKADALTNLPLPPFESGLESGRSEQDKEKQVSAGRLEKQAAHPCVCLARPSEVRLRRIWLA